MSSPAPELDIAVEQYARVSGTHWYDLELTATDNLTLERVTCRCPVVGNGRTASSSCTTANPCAVGKSEAQHHLLPVAARLIQGEPLRVVAERVAIRGHTLRWLVSRIDQSRPYYLLGEVEIADGRGPALTGRLDSVETYNPASTGAGFSACTTPALRNWNPGSISWPSGARSWCSSGSGRGRRR